MVNLIVLLIMLGCAGYMFLKGSAIKAFINVIAAVSASLVAFGYFELMAGYISKYLADIAPWAQTISFLFIFAFSFAILQALIMQVLKEKIELDDLPEKIVSVTGGLFLGFIISGVLLTATAMSPIPGKYPYERFSVRNPKADKPNKLLLNADGFVTGYFGLVSKGSLSAISDKQSFAVLHASYLDQLYLNRQSKSQEVSLITSEPALEISRKNSYWSPVGSIQYNDGSSISIPAGHQFILARVGIKKSALGDAGKFSLSQIRLICTDKDSKNPLAGKGTALYPIGYMTSGNTLQKKSLHEVIEVKSTTGDAVTMDLGFFMPGDMKGSLIQFKLNNIVELGPQATGENIPTVISFNLGSGQGSGTGPWGGGPGGGGPGGRGGEGFNFGNRGGGGGGRGPMPPGGGGEELNQDNPNPGSENEDTGLSDFSESMLPPLGGEEMF